jgi:hypothetical protein
MEFAGLPWDFRTQDRGHAGSALHRSVTALSVKKTLTVSGGTLAFLILPGGSLRSTQGWDFLTDCLSRWVWQIRGPPSWPTSNPKLYWKHMLAASCGSDAGKGDCSHGMRKREPRPGELLPPSFRSRDIEWTHRHAFKVPDSDAGRTHCAKMRSSSVRLGCAERVIKE